MIPNHIQKLAETEEIIRTYKSTGSIWETGKILNMNGQTVANKLNRAGIKPDGNGIPWTSDDDIILKRKYILYRDSGKLLELANKMGRTKNYICRKAKILGFTDKKHRKLWSGKWKYMEFEDAELLLDKFKKSKFNLGQFCERYGFDDNGFRNTMIKFFPDVWEHIIESKTSKQTPYRLGRQVEYNVRDAFKKNGFLIFRSPASKGPVDLVAIDRGVVVFIQCKRNMTMGVNEWNEFYNLAISVDAIPILAGRPTGYGLKYWKIDGLKDGSKRGQPKTDININDIRGLSCV